MSNKLKTLVMHRNNTELRECPFCGSENIRLYGDDENSYWCQCISCLASTSASDDRTEAIAAWNVRKDENKDE